MMLLGPSRPLSLAGSSLVALVQLVSLAACFGCESREAAPTPTPTPTPAPARSAHVHPDFPVRPSPEMIANSDLALQLQRRADEAAAAASAAAQQVLAKKWNASCLIHRECPVKEQALPGCDAGAAARDWGVLQSDADSLVGQILDIKGALALAISAGSSAAAKCAPDTCCHALRMDQIIDSERVSLPLAGLSCTGDESKLCCSVPANGQLVIAHGRLAKAKSPAKWRLDDVKLCEVPAPQVAAPDR